MADQAKRFRVSFDLGLRGEYAELYAWLDKQQAKECGENIATFRSEKSRAQIAKELKRVLNLQKGPRIYIIELHTGGKFFFGKRKVAPWAGYAQSSIDSDEET